MFAKKSSKLKIPSTTLIIIGLIIIVGIFVPISETNADNEISWAESAIISTLGWIAGLIISLLGTILGILIEQLVKLADYNHFIDSQAPPAVHIGWAVVRDFSNMLFIIALMVVAFGTILKIQTYHAKSTLVKLVIMAILINFSKTITGLFIDFSQVVMGTFVDAFRESAALVLAVGLNLSEMTSLAKEGEAALLTVIASMVLAVAMLIVAATVILAMVVVLLFRIIMIWVLVILSPIAYIATVMPNTKKYATQWWSALGKNLISGPLLAFFLWLALSIIATSGSQPISLGEIGTTPGAGGIPDVEIPKGASEVMSTQNMFNYIITIALLIMGLMMTQSLGVMGGKFAGSMVGRLQSAGTRPFRWAKTGALWGAKRIDDLQAKVQQRLAKTQFAKDVTAKLKRVGGKRFDLEGMRRAVEKHGVQFRTIKPAWEARKAKKEEQRLGEAPSVAQDILNRAIGGIRGAPDKTDYATIARAARSHKAESEIAAAGEEQQLLTYRLEEEFSNEDGTIRSDKIAEAEGTLRLLLNNHDINEWLKRPFFADIMKQYGRGSGKVTQKDLQVMLRHMFGNTRDTIRIAQNLEEAGLAKNDAWIKGIVEWNDKDREFEWTDDVKDPREAPKPWWKDVGAKISALYNAKKTGRTYINAQRRQNLFTERADDKNNLAFRELHNVGKQNLVVGADAYLATKLEHFQPEFKSSTQDNLDLLVEWWGQALSKKGTADEELNETQIDKLEKVIAKLAGGAIGYSEGEIDNIIGRKDNKKNTAAARAAAEKELREIIVNAVESRQTKEYWENMHKINEVRRAKGWDVGDTYNPTQDEAAYQQATAPGGSTKGVNRRLDWLRGTGTAPAPGAGGRTPSAPTPEQPSLQEAEGVVQNIEGTSPEDFSNVRPDHFKRIAEDLNKQLKEITHAGGLEQGEFLTILDESIKGLKNTLDHLPEDLKKSLSGTLDKVNLAGQGGAFKSSDDQIRTYQSLKAIQDSLEKQRQAKEKGKSTK